MGLKLKPFKYILTGLFYCFAHCKRHSVLIHPSGTSCIFSSQLSQPFLLPILSAVENVKRTGVTLQLRAL